MSRATGRGGFMLAAVLLASMPLAASATPPEVELESRSCAWTLKIEPDVANALYPDAAARYWVLQLPAYPGASLVIRGRYPHNRYISYTTYDAQLRSVDGIPDIAIAPDRGSVNTFRAGARRDVADERRAYTVRVVAGTRPAAREPNTLYTATDSDGTPLDFNVVYRTYLPDRGLGFDGGVGLPSVAYVTAAGEVPLPDCDIPEVTGTGLNESVAGLSPPLGTATEVADEGQIVWHKFHSLASTAATFFDQYVPHTGEPGPLTQAARSVFPPGGFADNPDNKYMTTIVSSTESPVVLIRVRVPVTPRTQAGQRVMGPGQLRYWSLCSNEIAMQRFYGCLDDEQLPRDRYGNAVVLVSPAAVRPRNAKPECGIGWLPMGATHDTVLILRNMLPAASFRHSIQAARFEHEAADLGPYYPDAHQATVATAEALGCRGRPL